MITLHLPAERQRHLIQATWRVNRLTFVLYWTFGAFFTAFGALAIMNAWQTRHKLDPLVYLVTALGLLQLAFPSFMVWRYRLRLARRPPEPCTVTVNEERVFVESPSVNGDFAWTLVSSVLESRDSFIVRQGKAVRIVLPKAEFVGDDLPAFRRLLVSRSLARG